jgi:hypothetical protein
MLFLSNSLVDDFPGFKRRGSIEIRSGESTYRSHLGGFIFERVMAFLLDEVQQ